MKKASNNNKVITGPKEQFNYSTDSPFDGIKGAPFNPGGNEKARGIRFADAVASRYSCPLDIARKFHHDAVLAGQANGVQLPGEVSFSGDWVYTANPQTGKTDKRQGYLAEIVRRDDGLIRPVITFSTFRRGGSGSQWKPDNLLWEEHAQNPVHTKHEPSTYREKAAQLEKEHTLKRELRVKADAAGGDVVAATSARVFASLQDGLEHPYLASKGISSHGAKVATARLTGDLYDRDTSRIFNGAICEAGDLVIPLYRDGEIVSLQRIKPGGDKRYLKGGSIAGAYYLIEGTKEGPAFVAEGFATGASVSEATGRDVYVAFSAQNLKAVADANLDIGAVAADSGDAGIKGAQATGLPYYVPGGDGDWNDYAQQHGIKAVADALKAVEMADRNVQSAIVNGWDLAEEAQAARYLVDGFLEEDAHGILGGASMTYKSFFALRLAHSICSGQDFMGRKVYKQGAVVYVCGEGQGAISRRNKALLIRLGRPEHPIVTLSASLTDESSMSGLLDKLKAIKPVLVIFDTFASLSGGIDENSNSEVGAALNLVRDTCRAAGASSLIVHHFGKDAEKGFRGASAFVNNVDYAFTAQKHGDFRAAVSCFKMKDGEHFETIPFKTSVVELGIFNQSGKQATSLVAENDAGAQYHKPLTQKEIMLMQLRNLTAHEVLPAAYAMS